MKPVTPQLAAFLVLLDLVSTATVYQQNGLSIDIPAEVPSDASDEVDPDFLGLAFEQAAWVRYATDDAQGLNIFSNNLINAIYTRTSGKPIIRLGGTSPDYANYIPDQQEPALPVSEQDNYQDIGGTTIGPSYWSIAKLFPDAKFMIQVPLATTNISETVAWAKAAVDTIGTEQIHSIQIGNEPDLYRDDFTGKGGMFLGPPRFQGTLNNESYVGNYTKYASDIRQNIDLPDHFFTTFDVAAHVDTPWVSQWTLDVETVFGLGIDKDNIVKEAAHHYYQNQAGDGDDLESSLMTMNLTHTNLDYLKRHINWLKQNRADVPFIINEIGNSLKVTNSYQYQARLGSALWAVDFYLYSLSIGVARFNYQQIMHSGFNLWLPHESGGLPAQVFSNYYSQPFLADFIGASGKTKVAKLSILNGESVPNLSAYGAFENGVAKRLAVANLGYWNKTSSGFDRPVASINFTLTSDKRDSITVTRLSSPDGAGAAAETITYAGSQWTFESMGKEVKGVRDDTEQLVAENGVVIIKVPASEAVLVYL